MEWVDRGDGEGVGLKVGPYCGVVYGHGEEWLTNLKYGGEWVLDCFGAFQSESDAKVFVVSCIRVDASARRRNLGYVLKCVGVDDE